MIIETCVGSKAAFCIEHALAGDYCVRRVDSAVSDQEAVLFRHREVAIAYGKASAALDRYLAALDHSSDAEAEFEEWLRQDEIFEMTAFAFKDAPRAIAPVSVLH